MYAAVSRIMEDATKERQIQPLTVRMSFWPLSWMMFNTSQSYGGSERNGRDLRQRRLSDRRNWPSCERNRIAMWFIRRQRGPYRARERRRPLRTKRPARRSPVRAFLESVNLVTSASLDRSKLAGTKGLQRLHVVGRCRSSASSYARAERIAKGGAILLAG